jgi:hypothetical protein
MSDLLIVLALSIIGLVCLLTGLTTPSIGDGLGYFFCAILAWFSACGLIVTRDI